MMSKSTHILLDFDKNSQTESDLWLLYLRQKSRFTGKGYSFCEVKIKRDAGSEWLLSSKIQKYMGTFGHDISDRLPPF